MVRMRLILWMLSFMLISCVLLSAFSVWQPEAIPIQSHMREAPNELSKSVEELPHNVASPKESQRPIHQGNALNSSIEVLKGSDRKSVLDLFRQVKDRAIARLEEDRVMHQQAPVSVTKLGTKIEPNEASTILLVTTWRSGSTFVSELIAQIPGTFYSFEPLITFGHFIPGANSTLKSNYLSDIFQCHFPQSYLDYHQSSTSNLTGTFNFWLPLNNFKRPSEYMFSQNFRVWEACQSVQNLGDDWNLCYNATLFNDLCQMYPVRLVKVIRGSVQEFSGMLSQFERLRIVFLARDPRGIVNSRRHVDWCEEDCMDLTSLCQGLDDNLDSIHALAQDFPSQIYFLRYEDLCLEPETHVTSLFSFLGHPVTAPIKKYILSHMTSSDKEMHGTRKVSKNRVFQWAQDLDVAKIRAIEGHCHSFMDKAGYLIHQGISPKLVEPLHFLEPSQSSLNDSISIETWTI